MMNFGKVKCALIPNLLCIYFIYFINNDYNMIANMVERIRMV